MAPNPPSRNASGLYPPSSTSAATVQYLNDRALTFASEWYFKPEGVKLVKERFEEQLRKRRIDAAHGWNEEDQTFRIRCHPGDVNRVWPLFYMVVANIIKDEAGEEEDDDSQAEWTAAYIEDPPFQSSLIERLEDYRKRTGQDETSDQDDTQSNSSEADPSDLFPEEIQFFKSKSIWPQNVDPDVILTLNLEEVATDNDIEELEILTGCQLVKVLNEGKIYIGGHSENKCTLALAKLDILRKYQSMAPYQKHIFYSEGEEDFKLVLKQIVDIKKHYFETTLLELLQFTPKCNYRTLHDAATVRIAPYIPAKYLYASVKTVKVTPAVKPEDKDRGLTEWIDFTYSRKGDPSEYLQDLATVIQTQAGLPAPMQSTPAPVQPAPEQPIKTRENKDAVIQLWAQNVVSAPIPPLGTPLQGVGQSGAVAANSGSTNKNETTPGWDSYKHFGDTPILRSETNVRQVSNGLIKGLSNVRIAMSARTGEAPPSRAHKPSVPQKYVQSQMSRPLVNSPPATPSQQTIQRTSSISTAQQVTNHSSARSSAATARTVSEGEFSQRLAASPSDRDSIVEMLTDAHEQTAAVPPRPAVQASTNENSDIDGYFYRQPEKSLLDDDICVLDFTDPIMQPMKLEDYATASPNTHRPRLESMQPLSEIETRTFHNTMNQRAPKPKPNPYAGRLPGPPSIPIKATSATANNNPEADPVPEFLQELEESFQDMMKPAQGFRGPVQVQAEFGRVLLNLIHNKHVTSKESTDNLKNSDSLQKLLASADFTSFTNVLTTSPGEMPYLLNLSGGNGKELWEKQSLAWDGNVKYEFCFVDRLAAHQHSRFRVVIDAESFATQIMRYRPLGSIYVHGTSRHWDFQVTATGVDSGRELGEKYGELATAVESSLHVPENSTTPILFFKLDEPMSKRFELATVRVHRICRYKSKDAKSLLKISELLSLDIDKTSVPKESSTYFKLSPGPPERKPCEKPGLGRWFEVSISSAQLDNLLEQNENLELGEEARWTPEGLSKLGHAKSIYLPAIDMLKKMDGIGQYNNNGVDVRSPTKTTASQVTQKPKDEFW